MVEKESDIQRGILDYLAYKNCLAMKFPSVGIFRQDTKQYIRQGRKGIADIIGSRPDGRFFAIEVKSKKGKPTQEQVEFLEEVRSKKGIGILAYSIDDVDKALWI